MENPYTLLGVPRDATPEAIHHAYRRLAKLCHPDLFPGETLAAARFLALSAANDVLSHADQRGRFDRNERATGFIRRPTWSPPRDDAASRPNGQPAAPSRGTHFKLTTEFLDAVNGATIWLTLPDGGRLKVIIPPGTTDGEVLRLHKRGLTNWLRVPTTDTLIEIHVNPHWLFFRHGQDIWLDVPVTQAEAVLGAIVIITTPRGAVRLQIPAGSANGTKLRLTQQGVPTHLGDATGDLLVTLRVVLGTGGAAGQPTSYTAHRT